MVCVAVSEAKVVSDVTDRNLIVNLVLGIYVSPETETKHGMVRMVVHISDPHHVSVFMEDIGFFGMDVDEEISEPLKGTAIQNTT